MLQSVLSPMRAALSVVREDAWMKVLLVGSAMSMLQMGLVLPVMPLFLASRGFSYAQLGFMVAVVAAVALALRLALAYRQELFAQPALVVGAAVAPAAAFPLYLVVETPASFVAVMTATTAAGIVYGLGYPVLLARAVQGNHMTKSFALFRVTGDVSYGMGVIAGAFLIAQSFTLAFYVASLISLAAAFVSAWLLLARDEGPRGVRSDARGGLAAIRARLSVAQTEARQYGRFFGEGVPLHASSRRNIHFASLHALLFGTALFMYPVFFPLLLVSEGVSFEWVGVVIAASWGLFGVSELVGAAIADATRRYRDLVIGSLVAASALNVVMWWGNLGVMISAWLLLAVADGLGRPVTYTYVAANTAPRAFLSALAMMESASGFTRILGPLLFAIIVSAFGLRNGLLGAGMLILLSAGALALLRASPTQTPRTVGDPA